MNYCEMNKFILKDCIKKKKKTTKKTPREIYTQSPMYIPSQTLQKKKPSKD